MSLAHDVRYSGRLLAGSPIFTATAVLSLAAGIAGTAAIFSLADALLLRARPGVANPATLVDIGRSTQGTGLDNFGYPLFEAMRSGSTLLDGMAAHQLAPQVMSLGDAQSSERVFAGLVSGNYFEIVGARPVVGRFFLPEEDRTPDTHPVAVLCHGFWSRRFGRDEGVVGRAIRLNNRPYTIVGVAERGFTGTTFIGADFWVPMAMDAHVRAGDRSLLNEHNVVWLIALGRLKPGVTMAQARDELHGIMHAYLTAHGDARVERWGVAVAPSARVPAPIAGPVGGFVGMLGGLTVLVLLIACSNVAGMLLARGLERRRELATRLAVGASRARLIRQLLLEGLTLALIAGIVSVPMTILLVGLLASWQPSLPIPLALDLRVQPRVHVVAFFLAAAAAVIFALLPALQTTRVDVAPALRGANASPDRRRAWLRQALVAGQVAIALLLLVVAGLFLRSLQEAATTDVGFNVEDVDTLQIDTRIAGYSADAEGMRVVETLMDRFRLVPGVSSVGASRMVPLQGSRLGLGALRSPGYAGPQGTDRVDADWDVVSAGYFETLQMGIVEGRVFGAQDRAGGPFVAIVNRTLAERLWPGEPAIGRTLFQQTEPGAQRALEIVGVVRDAKHRLISDGPQNFIYVPLPQQFMSEVTFYVRRAPGQSRSNDLRRAVASFDPMLPVIHTETLAEATSLALLPQRLAAWIAASVGSIGLFLAALGLYGLTAFSVSQRTREIAIRLAVGAPQRSVVWLVLRQATVLAAAGAIAGLALAAGVASLLGSFLVGLRPIDPLAFGLATAILSAVLLLSSWTPARRAARMDPACSLRAE
ncbi:MAG TPA: ADOP family duplicated permease [Vicinamibacterales bacterium]|nr:ADOP family duplicated permease [Vicinamibacterales bacterium]